MSEHFTFNVFSFENEILSYFLHVCLWSVLASLACMEHLLSNEVRLLIPRWRLVWRDVLFLHAFITHIIFIIISVILFRLFFVIMSVLMIPIYFFLYRVLLWKYACTLLRREKPFLHARCMRVMSIRKKGIMRRLCEVLLTLWKEQVLQSAWAQVARAWLVKVGFRQVRSGCLLRRLKDNLRINAWLSYFDLSACTNSADDAPIARLLPAHRLKVHRCIRRVRRILLIVVQERIQFVLFCQRRLLCESRYHWSASFLINDRCHVVKDNAE